MAQYVENYAEWTTLTDEIIELENRLYAENCHKISRVRCQLLTGSNDLSAHSKNSLLSYKSALIHFCEELV